MNKERNICIVGLGLLGGSYAMGLTDAGYTVTAVDVRPEAIRYALEKGIIAAGRAPYFIPEGGSNAVGSAGYLAMVPELLAQAGSLPVPPARLVCTMGSLGTFAGLWLGARAFGAPFSVTGVAVNPTTGYTREKAAALVNEMSAAYGLDIAAAPEDMDIIYADAAHDYAGSGYNVPDAKTRGAVELLARTEGIFLDPCYTAKSFRGFCDIARELDGGAIFVHTGGTPALWTQEHLDAFAADYWN